MQARGLLRQISIKAVKLWLLAVAITVQKRIRIDGASPKADKDEQIAVKLGRTRLVNLLKVFSKTY